MGILKCVYGWIYVYVCAYSVCVYSEKVNYVWGKCFFVERVCVKASQMFVYGILRFRIMFRTKYGIYSFQRERLTRTLGQSNRNGIIIFKPKLNYFKLFNLSNLRIIKKQIVD